MTHLENLRLMFLGLLVLWCLVQQVHMIVISLSVDDCLQRINELEQILNESEVRI